MPRSITVLKVFVASPSDVSEERAAVKEIADELNKLWKNRSIALEVVSWESDVYPSFGSDPQSVINEQVSDDYEIFIGLMWAKIGTPTKEAESGTVEEFRRAYLKFTHDKYSVILMLYFKDTPLAPSGINTDELRKVNDFKKEIKERGGIYKEFKSLENFRALLRLNLTAATNDWEDRLSSRQASLPQTDKTLDTTDEFIIESEDDEPGFLDIAENAFESSAKGAEVMARMTDAVTELGNKMTLRRKAFEALQPLDGIKGIKRAKAIARKSAIDMEEYVARTEVDLPIFSASLRDGIKLYSGLISPSTDLKSYDLRDLKKALKSVSSLKDSIAQTRRHIEDFMEAVDDLPRATTRFARAKRNTVIILGKLIDEFESGELLAVETELAITQTIDRVRRKN